jgi:hypothetical protein
MFDSIAEFISSTLTRLWGLLTAPDAKYVVDLLAAALTPMIGFATVYIAWQQRNLNKTRLRVELYDRQLAVYKAVDKFHGSIPELGRPTYAMIQELRVSTAEAPFLFRPEVEKHLAKSCKTATHAAVLHDQMNLSSGEATSLEGEERKQVAIEHGALCLWLQQEARAESRKLFGKYLKLV